MIDPERTPHAESVPARLLRRVVQNRKLWRDAVGLLLIALGIITFITLLGLNTGGIVGGWVDLLRQGFGIGIFILCIVSIAAGVVLVLNAPYRFNAERLTQIVAAEVAFLALLALVQSLAFGVDGYALTRNGAGGGAIGWVLSTLVWRVLGSEEGIARLLSIVFWFATLAISGAIVFRPLLRAEPAPPRKVQEPVAAPRRASAQPAALSQIPLPDAARTATTPPSQSATESAKKEIKPAPVTVKSHATIVKQAPSKAAAKKTPKKQLTHEHTLPPITLLKTVKENKNTTADAQRMADIIETTLAQFGLAGKVVEIRPGPTVTQFGIKPGYLERSAPNGEKRQQKIRVQQIASLQNDFALALSATNIRIEAPIPGRGLVGIEVPNLGVTTVDLRGVMESEPFLALQAKTPLAVGLGRDVSGTAISADLSRMPHLLIAGTTGSGKSICISSIAVCLCMHNRPEDLKLVLIDPKMVELSRFNGLPHIIGKPESDMDRIPGVLRWVTREMDSRYKAFAEVGARNVADYNEGALKRNEDTLPRIVVLIDELADMMLQSPIETEKTLCRLAQMARATGIHLVVATQRPSVDVVTGLIKANFPARISFAVASSTDSRVILDQVGAESLIGRGDMLYLNPESGHPMRLQGCFVSDKEVESLIAWWKKQMDAEKKKQQAEEPEAEEPAEEYVANRKPDMETPWEITVAEMAAERLINSGSKSSGGSRGAASGSEDDGDDELIKRAIDILKSSGNASTSLLQRKLRIGYPRAARLMEELQEMGYVGAANRQAGKTREIKRDDDED